jgi:hypothetical protein
MLMCVAVPCASAHSTEVHLARMVMPPLLLEVVRIHRPLFDALIVAEGAGLTEELVDERRLAVIDVGDDRHVAEGHSDFPWGKRLARP